MARRIEVEIVADTSQFKLALKEAEFLVARSFWRRTLLRLALWRLKRKAA